MNMNKIKLKLFWIKIKNTNWYKWFNIKHNCKLIKSSYVDIVTEKLSEDIAIEINSGIMKELMGIEDDVFKEKRLKQNENFYKTITHIKHMLTISYWHYKFFPKNYRKKYI